MRAENQSRIGVEGIEDLVEDKELKLTDSQKEKINNFAAALDKKYQTETRLSGVAGGNAVAIEYSKEHATKFKELATVLKDPDKRKGFLDDIEQSSKKEDTSEQSRTTRLEKALEKRAAQSELTVSNTPPNPPSLKTAKQKPPAVAKASAHRQATTVSEPSYTPKP